MNIPRQNLVVIEEKIRGLKLGRAILDYLRRGYGLACNCVILALIVCPALLLVFFRIFVTHWVSAPFAEQSLPHWRIQFAILAPLVLLSGGTASLLIANVFLAAGGSLHNAMLERLARSPMSFFVSHPLGRILNRFSKDTAIADSVLVKQLLVVFQVILS